MAEYKLTEKNDLTNQRFGRLVALNVAFKSKRHYLVWNCRCDCGKDHLVVAGNLKSGQVRSCGCLQKDTVRAMRTTHGDSQKGTAYRVWQKMKERCKNPKAKGYADYGGRGIRVCDEWAAPDGYAAFIAHIGPRPSLGHTLERKQSDGNYEPGNVEWVPRADQNRNKRNTRNVTFNGETKTETEWAKEFGIKPGMLWHRLHVMNMPFHEAVVAPSQKPRRKVEYQGKQVTIKQLAMLTGVSYERLRARIIRDGQSVEQAVAPVREKAKTLMIEYNGRTLSVGEWSRITGLDDLTIRDRITKKEWSAARALTAPSKTYPDRFRHPDLHVR